MLNLKRGLLKSLLFGLVGFLTPTVLLSIPRSEPSASQSRSERQDQIKRNAFYANQKPAMILRSGSLCAIVFALAAFAAYAPNTGIRFMRTLMIISSVTGITIIITHLYTPIRKGGISRSLLIDPGIPIVAAVVATAILVIVSVRKTSTASLPESP